MSYIKEWHQKELLAKISGDVVAGMDAACAFAAGEAEGMVPVKRRVLKGDIGYKVNARGDVITGYVGVKKGKAFYAWFVEVGTRARTVTVDKAKVLSNTMAVFGKKATIPAGRAQPFLRPAVFNNAAEIVRLIARGGR